MPRVHDRGGWPETGSVPREEHRLSAWEKETDALYRVLASPSRRLIGVDELRRAIESLDPEEYEELGYYERWMAAIENLLVEKGVLTHEAIDERTQRRASRR